MEQVLNYYMNWVSFPAWLSSHLWLLMDDRSHLEVASSFQISVLIINWLGNELRRLNEVCWVVNNVRRYNLSAQTTLMAH